MDEEHSHPAKDRPDGVNKKRIPELDLDAKIPIYHKPSAQSANTQLIPAFPKEVLTLFSKAAMSSSRRAQDNDQKFDLYQILGGDLASFKLVLNWIKDCIDQQSITKFPDLPENEDDPFGPTLKVMQAANILDIPAGSLQFFLEKRLDFIARKHLMSFDQVREFYTMGSELHRTGLQLIACSSIFNAWWDYRLDATVNPELMIQLADLRAEFPQLDQDLHEACKNKESEVTQRKLEKKLKREAERQAFDMDASGGDAQAWESNTFTAASGDWENVASGDASAWDTSNDWNKENQTSNNISIGNSKDNIQSVQGQNSENQVLDWADESAAEFQMRSQDQIFTNVPSGGW